MRKFNMKFSNVYQSITGSFSYQVKRFIQSHPATAKKIIVVILKQPGSAFPLIENQIESKMLSLFTYSIINFFIAFVRFILVSLITDM